MGATAVGRLRPARKIQKFALRQQAGSAAAIDGGGGPLREGERINRMHIDRSPAWKGREALSVLNRPSGIVTAKGCQRDRTGDSRRVPVQDGLWSLSLFDFSRPTSQRETESCAESRSHFTALSNAPLANGPSTRSGSDCGKLLMGPLPHIERLIWNSTDLLLGGMLKHVSCLRCSPNRSGVPCSNV